MSFSSGERRRVARLEQDRALVAASDYGASWPHLRWSEAGKDVVFEGQIEIDEGLGCPEIFEIRIVFGPDYPEKEPEVFETAHRIAHIADRHFYDNGRCCLWHWLQSSWKGHDPQAILHFLDQIAVFFHRQLICDTVGEFPGPQLKHGWEGTRQAMVSLLGSGDLLNVFTDPLLLRRDYPPNSPCPCGSDIKYKRCHQGMVERIRHQVSVKQLKLILDKGVA
ncbi:MAG TPA: SEC-C domain-containing protein [Abditibacterium sp.]